MNGGRAEREIDGGGRLRVGVISLGCAKNLVDTEVMLGHLDRAGCEFVRDPRQADVILVNTCGFIEPAREESVQAILEAAQFKKDGRLRRLVVAGCMVQRYRAELARALPEVDAFVGLDELDRVVSGVGLAPAPVRAAAGAPALRVLRSVPRSAAAVGSRPSRYLYDDTTPRKTATPAWSAYIKIAEGCDHGCAFCAIPGFRGRFRSRPVQSVVREARELAGRGVAEINLI
ncbi:MAG TPA: radical SAM protein, partial [Candidatus Polarisedimenticolaceae bacterium]|nr:radical SAM protein [Candidatus Polarisedimenticolaceae bacterium]